MEYKIIKSFRKTLSLTINNSGDIIIKVPFFIREKTITDFIKKNKTWIEKRKNYVKNRQKNYVFGEKFLFFGEDFYLKETGGNIFFNEKNFLLKKEITKKQAKEKFINFYKKEAKNYIFSRIEKIAKENNFEYKNLKITSAKSRWGSCTSKKNINFSYRLIMSPKNVIDYVIIHELCHLKELNHSKNFWNLVEKITQKYNLDYKKSKIWLKNNTYKTFL